MLRRDWIEFLGQFSERDSELLLRTYDVLMNNVYESGNYLWMPYRCISPGKETFQGIWNWDSAFHSVGVSRYDYQLAKEGVLGFLKFQKENGFLPDCIFEDGTIVESCSKPPVFAWAAQEMYKREGDLDFLKEIYPKLSRNVDFWENERLYNGLFFYDASNKESETYLTYAKYESGWDNSVRWDNGITNHWPIDLNCYMVMFYRSMSFFANELGIIADAEKWGRKHKELSELINQKMWNGENRYYADVNRFTGEYSTVLSPASFMPLYIDIATVERADAMRIIAEDKFNYKMPTVSFDNPQYSNDYWRGPTWLNVAYFAAKGLKNYKFEVADKIKDNILNMCYNEKNGIYENYDSVTGKGLCCDHFSWSCVFITEFILNF